MPLRWIKVHYVWVYAVLGALLPYLPLYLRDLGLSDSQIGWVAAEFGVAVIVAPLAFTFLADRWLSNRLLMGLAYVASVVTLLMLMAAGTFSAALVTYGLFTLAFTAMIPLIDGLTFGVLEANAANGGARVGYHRVRIWGTIGFMLPAIGLFFAMRFGASSRWAVGAAAVAALCGAATAFTLPPRRPPDKVAALPTLDAIKTLRRPEVAAFVISVFLMSTAVGVFYTFYPLYLRELEIADAWVGLIVNLGVLVEVFFMLGAGWLLNRMGVRGVMIAGAGAVVLRLGLLTFVPTAPVAIGTQVLHGPFVIAQYLVPVMYLNHKAADSHRNSMQGLYALLCFGLARVVGSIVGGHLSDAGAAAGDSHLFGLRVTLGFGFVLAVFAMGGLGLGFHDRPASEHLRAQHS